MFVEGPSIDTMSRLDIVDFGTALVDPFKC